VAFLLLVQAGEVNDSDGASMLAVAHSLVAHLSLAISQAQQGFLGKNGHSRYSIHGLGLSIIAVPAVALALLLGHFMHHESTLEGFLAASLMPIIGGLIAVEVYRISRSIGGTVRWSALVAFGTVWCTNLLPYVDKIFLAEPLACLALLFAIDSLLCDRVGWASLALGLAILTRFECVLVLPGFCLVEHLRYQRRAPRKAHLFRLLALSLGSVIAVGITALYNWYRFGGATTTGYPKGQDFTLHVAPAALYGLFFSPSKSIFLFAPILLVVPLALVRLRAAGSVEHHAFWLLTANFAAALIADVLWSAWNETGFWGPRLLLPGVVPLVCAIGYFGQHIDRVLTLIAFGLGALVSAPTIVVSTQYQQLLGNGQSTVWKQYQGLPNVIRYTVHHFHKSSQLARGTGANRHFVLIWQIGVVRELGNEGIPIAVVGTLALTSIALFALNQLRITTRSLPSDAVLNDGAMQVSPVVDPP
jgi:hypothetical protein